MQAYRDRVKHNLNDSLELAKMTLAKTNHKTLSSNPQTERYQSRLMDPSLLDKHNMNKVIETRIKLEEQELKMRLKDQEMATRIIQLAKLRTNLRMKNLALLNINDAITKQRYYLRGILKVTKSLRLENITMKRAIQELENLKKVNKAQEILTRELTEFYNKHKGLVKLIQDTERKNKVLKEMVQGQASVLQKQEGADSLAAFFASSRFTGRNSNGTTSVPHI